jgi:hypothetical protein
MEFRAPPGGARIRKTRDREKRVMVERESWKDTVRKASVVEESKGANPGGEGGGGSDGREPDSKWESSVKIAAGKEICTPSWNK